MIVLQVTKHAGVSLSKSKVPVIAARSLLACSGFSTTAVNIEDFGEEEEQDEEDTARNVERGFLFSAPCLDPEIRNRILERRGENDEATEGNVQLVSRVEKGILFSAPCLDMDRDGEYRIMKEQVTDNTFEKSFEVFRHPRDPALWTCQPKF